ncbi:hypothetical protein [Chelativorans sp. Marseille-P2723]|uniref:hypothetical protein n=1 Tax=Chelativorans sp. Marseille-P2723 TaxID=2709133 RepID=UPI00156FB9DE|nr:hypothetical protein [Chelativorans sp. Marseille-P2723]
MPIGKAGCVQAFYDLEATVLEAHADNDRFLEGLDYLIGERRLALPRAATFRLDITVGIPPPPEDEMEVLYQGPLLDEGSCIFGRIRDAYVLNFPGAATLNIFPDARTAELIIAEGRLVHTRGNMIALALEFALDSDGQQVVHCAGVSLPDSDRALLLCAPSGTGKTTTALALAEAGFPLAADDAMVLRIEDDDIRAWGLPRAMKVHRKTAEMLPFLAAVMGSWNDNGEQAIPRARLEGVVSFDRRNLRVTDIFLLNRSGSGRGRLRPIPRAEMLAALAADNIRRANTGLTPLQSRRYAMLAKAVDKASAFELDLPHRITHLTNVLINEMEVR